MAKFFQKLKKQRSRNSAASESPPITSSSVGTQSEPLPASFHLDGLLNSSVPGEGLRRQISGVHEEVDGAMFSVGASVEGVGGGHGPLHLPRPLIPSPPFTLSRSPTPAQLESVHFQLLPLSSQQPQTTPSHSTPSPTFPPVFSGQSHSGNFPPVFSGQRNSLTFSPVSSAERNSSRHRQNSAVQTTSTPTSTGAPAVASCERGTEDGDGEEVRRCQAALQALELREKRLITEVVDLRTELRASCAAQPTTSPHPEAVVAELEESLRQAEEAVQAVEGERDDLREGVEKMEDELVSLQRSNSLLARRKQQWMEVASQTRVVLEENCNLISQCKAQQLTISELRTKHHTKVVELEGELAEVNEVKKSLEYEVEQLMEGQALLFHQISRLTGVSLSHGATSPESVQHVASLLERFVHDQRRQLAAWQEQTACLEREKQVLVGKVEEAKAVTRKLERELGQVQRVVQEGEETVARLRDQLEELHEQEEATQLQLAHALTQVDKAMSERDIYAGVAKRWQAKGEGEATKARDEAQHQLRVQTAQHRSQHRRYKTEIHQLKSLLSQDNSVGEGTRRHLVSERHRHS